jgi:hypothetical protein
MELVANFCQTLYSDEPPDPWPPPSTILVSRLFEEARYMYEKSDYFRSLQLATNWTSRAHTYTGLSVSGQCHAICAIGDSVIGEVGTRFKRVLANRKCPLPGSCGLARAFHLDSARSRCFAHVHATCLPNRRIGWPWVAPSVAEREYDEYSHDASLQRARTLLQQPTI